MICGIFGAIAAFSAMAAAVAPNPTGRLFAAGVCVACGAIIGMAAPHD